MSLYKVTQLFQKTGMVKQVTRKKVLKGVLLLKMGKS